MRFYWPAALAVVVPLFIAGTFAGFTGWALLAGTVVIGAPELWFVVHRQWASTLSDWWWRAFHLRGRTPVPKWGALEVLGLGAMLAVCVRADLYLATLGYWPCAGGAVMTAWLPPHLFRRWWR